MRKVLLLILTVSIFFSFDSNAQRRSSVHLEHGAHRIGKRTDADMQHWRDHGLGQFIHWGVYAIPGGFYEDKYYPGAAEWIRSWREMPKDVYDNYYKEFNPKNFDAKKWARQAKDMGAKYLIFTTKHHDGFCMWPSKYTDYSVASSPYKKDIVREIVKAYTNEGIEVHLYFSIIDWNHPGYRSAPAETEEEKAAYEEFKTFTRNQLFELLDMNPEVRGLWFDGSWDKAWIEQAAWTDQLGEELRAARPGLIIGSRFRADENGKRHYDTNGDLIDDYDQTWERHVPDNIAETNNVDWDCVMTIPENQWGYHREWRGYVKTPYDLIEMMVKSVSMNGNFVVNFGPDGLGNIRPEETEIAAEMGRWMKVNGEAVYGTSHVPYKQQGWGYFTGRDNKVYMTVFNPPLDNRIKIEIPRGSVLPEKAYFLDGGKKVEIIDGGRNKLNNRLFQFVIPDDYKPAGPFVIVFELEEAEEEGSYHQAIT